MAVYGVRQEMRLEECFLKPDRGIIRKFKVLPLNFLPQVLLVGGCWLLAAG